MNTDFYSLNYYLSLVNWDLLLSNMVVNDYEILYNMYLLKI